MRDDIQMVDLAGQYQRLKVEIDEAIDSAVRSAKYINGPEVQLFANELASYLGAKHVIPVANGTDALQIAMMAAGVGPGDEVVTPDFTFISTAEAAAALGATVVPVDVRNDDFTLDISRLEAAFTSRTRAVVPVHLYGQCADMDAISEICARNGVVVIEDTAQACGADYQGKKVRGKAATLGHLGCLSFFPSKNLGCFGDGGAVVTNDDALAQSVRKIANHGSRRKYHHERLGKNSRLDTLQAAVLRVKLRHLDAFNVVRREAADRYDTLFTGFQSVVTPVRRADSQHIFHQYTLKVSEGKNLALQSWLKENGVPSMIYYPEPIHRQPAFHGLCRQGGSLDVSKALAQSVISLPMHTELTDEMQVYIAAKVKEFLQ